MPDFDVQRVLANLHGAALGAGAPPLGDGTANFRAHIHSGESCNARPCRKAGIGLAIQEIETYLAEVGEAGPLLVQARQIETLQEQLEGCLQTLAVVVSTSPDLYQRQRHGHEWRMRCAQIYESAIALATSVEGFGPFVRGRLFSREFVQVDGQRPADRLLTAVNQHLRRTGGLSYPAIASLVPDRVPGSAKHAAERVRWRCRSPDERSLLPNEDLPGVAKAPLSSG
jgi:hypothetical protein